MEKNLNDDLEIAISTYDFDKMVDCCKNGCFPKDIILHRVINKDKVDLLEFFLFSKTIKQNIKLHYDYPLFGKEPAIVYAASCGAIQCCKFLLEDERTKNKFSYENISNSVLLEMGTGNWETIQYLTNNSVFKNYGGINLKTLTLSLKRKRFEILDSFFSTNKDLELKEIFLNSNKEHEKYEYYFEMFKAQKEKEILILDIKDVKITKKIKV